MIGLLYNGSVKFYRLVRFLFTVRQILLKNYTGRRIPINQRYEKIKQLNLLFLLKTGIGSAAAILLADWFGLSYSPSAGIITLLTLQNTKKETIQLAVKRILAFVLAVAVSFLAFTAIGYTSVAFGVMVLIFVGLCTLLGLKDGISMNAVLMTHFLMKQRMDLPLIINEILLLLIGMGIGIIINLLMPNRKVKIRRDQLMLEEEMKRMLASLAVALRTKDACLLQECNPNVSMNSHDINVKLIISQIDSNTNLTKAGDQERIHQMNITEELNFKRLDFMLEELLKHAYEDAGNTLLADTRYQVSYLEMRKLQIDVLKDIWNNINRIPVILRQSVPIASFMEHTAASFHELNNVKKLLDELEELLQYFKNESLPVTREEFEYRAILFQILKEFEYFLLIKRNFIADFETKNLTTYWNR